jgi:hypothetical protein
VFLAYLVAGVATLFLFAAVARLLVHETVSDAAYGALAASWSNWGYMGFALLPALLGPQSLAVVIGAGMADLLVVVSAGLALASLEGHAGGVRAALAGALRGAAANPLVWAVVAGAAVSAAEVSLPVAVLQFTRLLGEAAGPVALFTIGASLYRPGTRMDRTEVFIITGAKLVVHPYLVALSAAWLFALGAAEVRALVLTAALPVAGTVFLFAQRAGASAERIAAAILVSTALAFASFSALCWLLGVSTPLGPT